jgi:hypothetical protein
MLFSFQRPKLPAFRLPHPYGSASRLRGAAVEVGAFIGAAFGPVNEKKRRRLLFFSWPFALVFSWASAPPPPPRQESRTASTRPWLRRAALLAATTIARRSEAALSKSSFSTR